MLKGKVALVTGASRGIGRAIAIDLAKQGANVVVNYAGNEQKANEVVDEIKKLGSDAIAVRADVANADDVTNMVKQTVDTFGQVDILVNNAGVTKDNLLMRMKEEEWDTVINTNLKGVFLCTKAVTRQMMKQRAGRIINISSIVGVSGNAGQANYAASKAGLIGLTKSIAREVAGRNVRVNAVAPGFIESDMTEVLSDKVKDAMKGQIPMKRFGMPEEIATATQFLAEQEYMTGQVLTIDGGVSM